MKAGRALYRFQIPSERHHRAVRCKTQLAFKYGFGTASPERMATCTCPAVYSRARPGRSRTDRNLGPPSHSTDSNPPRRRGAFLSICWIGLVAGTLDISENLIFNSFRSITPYMIFQ